MIISIAKFFGHTNTIWTQGLEKSVSTWKWWIWQDNNIFVIY